MNSNSWYRTLIWEAKYLMRKRYYSIGSAMQTAWDRNYKSIVANDNIDIVELRNVFWSKGLSELTKVDNEILRRYENEYTI
ncbi:MAG: hypothetical protein ACRDA0_09980 [Cetobacterium sp.]|uniref:hypothetical protein n=1 Tax=Cetobacterium sp. TaxID=2071632 RepID=UPI003F3E8C86